MPRHLPLPIMIKHVGVLLVFSCFFPSLLCAGTSETIRMLNATYQKAKHIEAAFSQTVRFLEFDTESISTGKVFLKKGKMRWDYITPEPQQIFIDGDVIMHYVPAHQQVMKGRIGSQTGLPIDLFIGMDKIESLFQISESGPATAISNDEIILIPKEKGSQITQMVLTLIPAKKTGGLLIQKVAILEENGNQSLFVFKDFQINKTFQDDPFLFHLPKGVEIIELP